MTNAGTPERRLTVSAYSPLLFQSSNQGTEDNYHEAFSFECEHVYNPRRCFLAAVAIIS